MSNSVQKYQFSNPDYGTLELKVDDTVVKVAAGEKVPRLPYQLRGVFEQASDEGLPDFYEWQSIDYLFQSSDAAAAQAPFQLFVNQKRIAESQSIGGRALLNGRFRFKNAIGQTAISLYDRNGKLLFQLETEVFPQKMDYREDYQSMMADITEIVYNLAFDFFKDTFERSKLKESGQATLIEYLAIIEVLFESLDKSVEVIRRQPKHNIEQYREVKDAHRAKKLAPGFQKWLRENGRHVNREGNGLPIGNGQFAAKVPEQRKRVTFDNFENRFVKWAMLQIQRQLREVEAFVEDKHPQAERPKQRIRGFKQRIAQRLQQAPFSEVSPFSHQFHFSTTLTMAAGYKDFLHKFLILQRGLSISDNALFRIDVKDIATLYEYWCFLKIVALLKEDDAYELISQDLIKIQGGRFVLNLKQGTPSRLQFRRWSSGEQMELFFNRTFTKDDKRVFTYNQRPDYAIQFKKEGYNEPFWYLFDAKYRFTEKSSENNPVDFDAPDDAIGQLHRYRDAILHTEPTFSENYRAAVKNLGGIILYPYPGKEQDFKNNKFYESIQEVNIGALPFLPSKTTLFKRFLDDLLNVTPEQHFEQFTEMDRREYQAKVKSVTQEVYVIGVVPKKERSKRLELLEKEGIYGIRLNEHQNAQLRIFQASKLITYLPGPKSMLHSLHEIESMQVLTSNAFRDWGANWPLSAPQYLVYRVKKQPQLLRKKAQIPSLQYGYRYTTAFGWAAYDASQYTKPGLLSLNDYNSYRLYQELTRRGIAFAVKQGQKEHRLTYRSIPEKELIFNVNGIEIINIPGRPQQEWEVNGSSVSLKEVMKRLGK